MKRYLALICVFAAALGGCRKDFLSLEKNPNVPSVASPNLLLAGALRQTADVVNGGINLNYAQYACYMGYISYSTSYQTNNSLELYGFTTSDYNVWTPLYLNLSNYNALTAANAGPYYAAIAKIMTAYNYEALVDNYNNVPYTSALKGTGVLNPTYDNGSAIYDDLMKQLDAAIVLINAAPATAINPGSADIMFGGTMTSWVKFANTLKLKLAIRQSNLTAKAAALQTAVQATQAMGYLDGTTGASVNPGYTNIDANGGQQSPIWLDYGYTQGMAGQSGNARYQAGSAAVNYFLTHNDTARAVQLYQAYYAATDVSKAHPYFVSTYFGDRNPPAGSVSKLGPGILKSATMNAQILSSAEALFLQSEGVAEGLITGNAATLYNAGITADFIDIGLTAAQAATYYGQMSVAYPTGGTLEDQKKAIITQKWAALDIYGAFEAYNEQRRTGYPVIPLSKTKGANAPNQVTRIYYPFVEYSTNAKNVAAQGTINIFTSKIFWAK